VLLPSPSRDGFLAAERLPALYDHVHYQEKYSMGTYQIFIYLQLLDLLTTLLGFRLGAAEASPFIRLMMHVGPATGVIASKVLALGIGGLCFYLNKSHVIRWISYWFGGLVIWNLIVMLAVPGHMG
jgi:hypothetical protein